MANYPTGVFSPSAKANGQVIQASFFNDPDAEITAIEDGLLNGLQHGLTISTGGLTVSTGGLRVGGGSTFHNGLTVLVGDLVVGPDAFISGGLHIGGASSFAGAVVFSGAVTFATTPNLNPPRVNVKLTGSTTLSTVARGIDWDTERYDSHGMHSTSVNSSRLTFAGSTGVYHVGGSLFLTAAIGVTIYARIMVNDSSVVAGTAYSVANDTRAMVSVSADVHATSTADYVTLQAFSHANASTVAVGLTEPGFWAHRIG